MTSSAPMLIDTPNLSLAWAHTFQKVDARPGKEVMSLVVSFTGFTGAALDEDARIREALDGWLEAVGLQSVETVAGTIFPQSLWLFAKGDRQRLYDLYTENLPSYVSMDPHKNSRGLYFARLVAYDTDPKTGERLPGVAAGSVEKGNQLEFVIRQCKPGVRRSKFHAAVFDPMRDHTPSAQLGFPCLQYVTFVPHFERGSLALNAVYATQQLFEKAYGNFLGLARLGMFVADQTGLEMERVTCFVGIEKMDRRPRGDHLSTIRGLTRGVLSEDGQAN